MSRETLTHLNSQTLIGNTSQRGTAWHYRAEEQGEETNHYPGPIPVADVERRLFSWEAESRPVAVEVPADLDTMTHLDAEGQPMRWQPIHERQAITRSDTHDVMGIFTTGYVMHQYREWLLTTVANILDDSLAISSAGLLKNGAVAWVEVSVPETITTPEGFAFRPNLLATTSFDGSIATTFKRTVTATVCDNTRDLALSEKGQSYKVKHSRFSQARITEAREALAMIHSLADDFAAEVAQLASMPVAESQWTRFLENYVRVQDPKTHQPLTGRAKTIADHKRRDLERLYRHDDRAAPWTGSALGVLQAVNTYEHHGSTVRGTSRSERNMLRTINGGFTTLDRFTLEHLTRLQAA